MAASPVAAASPARIVSLACWAVVVVVVLRIASGGGTLQGVGYVLHVEPVVVVAFGAGVLVIAATVIVALLRDLSWSWRASLDGAIVTVIASLLLLLGGHDSALASMAAAGIAAGTAYRVLSLHGGRPPHVGD